MDGIVSMLNGRGCCSLLLDAAQAYDSIFIGLGQTYKSHNSSHVIRPFIMEV
jgi:hypothetical protein